MDHLDKFPHYVRFVSRVPDRVSFVSHLVSITIRDRGISLTLTRRTSTRGKTLVEVKGVHGSCHELFIPTTYFYIL